MHSVRNRHSVWHGNSHDERNVTSVKHENVSSEPFVVLAVGFRVKRPAEQVAVVFVLGVLTSDKKRGAQIAGKRLLNVRVLPSRRMTNMLHRQIGIVSERVERRFVNRKLDQARFHPQHTPRIIAMTSVTHQVRVSITLSVILGVDAMKIDGAVNRARNGLKSARRVFSGHCRRVHNKSERLSFVVIHQLVGIELKLGRLTLGVQLGDKRVNDNSARPIAVLQLFVEAVDGVIDVSLGLGVDNEAFCAVTRTRNEMNDQVATIVGIQCAHDGISARQTASSTARARLGSVQLKRVGKHNKVSDKKKKKTSQIKQKVSFPALHTAL